MRISTTLMALVCASVLAGCATAQLEDLKDVKDQRGMLITEPISFVFGESAIMMRGAQAGLQPGYYPATKENSNGIFYLGIGHCVWYKGKDFYSLVTGGIWLPNNTDNPARLFSVVGSATAVANTLDDAAAYCKQPKVANEKSGLTNPDLQTVLLPTPQALGIAPVAPKGTIVTQAVGGAIGFAIAQAIADSAKGEYQGSRCAEQVCRGRVTRQKNSVTTAIVTLRHGEPIQSSMACTPARRLVHIQGAMPNLLRNRLWSADSFMCQARA
ncbi:MAG: hypothetical protein V4772_19400, partial [Pseudomonadota bacterium]